MTAHLADPASETPKPGDPRLANTEYRLVGSPIATLEAAAKIAAEAGYAVINQGDGITGFSHVAAREQAVLAARDKGERVCILSGGETTVQVRGKGRGGRNSKFLLALAIATEGTPEIHALACDTDGIDGTESNAGAWFAPEHWTKAKALGLDPEAFLANNDAYSFFEALDALVVTGPTLTNVNDFCAILVDPG